MLLLPAILRAQAKQDSPWEPMKFFVGKWTGTGEGEPGKGSYERSYQFVLNGKFIETRNKSVYPPQEKNKAGEVHEDIGYISYDKTTKTFVFRQFHTEGFVNEYRLEKISQDHKTISFISYAIENIPAGWRARETYQIVAENEFVETFELAEPGKDFQTYTRTTLTRVP